MREAEDLPDRFYEVFVVDPGYHLIGSVALNRLLRSKRPTTIESITDSEIHPIEVEADQEAVAREFERYNLTSAPVVDTDNRLVGVITADDVVEVVKEEASEDILRMGGVAGESVFDPVLQTTQHRFLWLFVNLGTAILASLGHQPVRRYDSTNGGACRADADRGLDGRQCRHADHDRRRARAGHARARHGQRAQGHRQGDRRSGFSTAFSSP